MVNYRKHRPKGKIRRRKKKAPYRAQIPRTIQIATKRNMNQTLKFVINQTWVVDPSDFSAGKSVVLSYRANSIYNSHMPTGASTLNAFKSQDPAKYSNDGSLSPVISQNADGWDQWTNRYQHFCVVGSKITYTFEPTGTGTPAIFFSHLSGVSGAVTTDTASAKLNELPYTKRHSLATQGITSGIYASTGVRGSMNYSCRKFEGVKDPEDNSNLRGRFANANLATPTTGNPPSEQSFFYLGMASVDPATTGKLVPGVLRVKLEYITQLKEPTDSNQIQVQVSDAGHPDEL